MLFQKPFMSADTDSDFSDTEIEKVLGLFQKTLILI
jgi:hypothetical protein